VNFNPLNEPEQSDDAGALGHEPEPKTMPLGVGGFGESAEPQPLPQPTRRLRSGTIILAGVVLVAGAGLYSMRALGRASGAIVADPDLEKTVDGFLESAGEKRRAPEVGAPDLQSAGAAMAVLAQDRTDRQVPLTEVQKNPFIQFSAPQTGAPVDTGAGNDAIAAARATAKQQFEKAASKLRLLMVMGGAEPMANLNGRVVRVGDVVADERLGVEFTVTDISPGAVTITGEDASIGFRHDVVITVNRDR
jgi:hypothetical protein